MKRGLTYTFLIFTLFFLGITTSFAAKSGIVNDSGVRFRSGPGTTYPILKTLNTGASLAILDEVRKENSGCDSNIWYQATYDSTTGYICSDYVTVEIDSGDITDKDYASYLKELGFSEGYIPSLTLLHEKYPNWIFKPMIINTNFDVSISKQDIGSRSLIQGDEGYRSTASRSYDYKTNKFIAKDGTNWYIANYDTIAYYLDPRNWLAENTIFMFEDLSYQVTDRTKDVVTNILSKTNIGNYNSNYANDFMDAGKNNNISPIYLASRVRQEVGTSTSVISGASFSYNGNSYSKIYNPYNIGATSGIDNWKKGLIWANGGEKGDTLVTSYGRPWNTLTKAINGGASFIAEDYISKKQNTTYLQKFNVANGEAKMGSHQYMQNIMAPVSEAKIAYSSYKEYGILEDKIVFTIPVYSNMPKKTNLPPKGNPNNYLQKINVDGASVPAYDGDNTEYTVKVANDKQSVQIDTWRVTTKSTVIGEGKVNLTGLKTVQNIEVIAENGAKRVYTITILKDENNSNEENKPAKKQVEKMIQDAGYEINGPYLSKLNVNLSVSDVKSKLQSQGATVTLKNANNATKNSGVIVTNDKIIISNGEEEKEYIAVLYGDNNGDGKTTIIDLLKIQKHLLKAANLSGAYEQASDLDRDSKISIIDLLKTQKYLLNQGDIKQ